MLKGKKIGILGLGNMGKALLKGFLQSQVISIEDVKLYDIHSHKMQEIIEDKEYYANDPVELVQASEIVILAVKPQNVYPLLIQLKRVFRPDHLLLSIVAGITTETLELSLEQRVPVIRIMPNLPVVVGLGASAFCLGTYASWPHGVVANLLFGSVGNAIEVMESQMDTVTALSGSGPAYVFYLAEVLTEAGIREGLSKEIAESLATQTILGGATLLHKSPETAQNLRRQVTSPNGTTAAAMKIFEQENMLEMFCKGLHAARKRAEEMSNEFHSQSKS